MEQEPAFKTPIQEKFIQNVPKFIDIVIIDFTLKYINIKLSSNYNEFSIIHSIRNSPG